MTRAYHKQMYKDLISTANFMYDSLFAKRASIIGNSSHAREYFIILHLAIEHLLKAGLRTDFKTHNLESLLKQFERDTRTSTPAPISERVSELNKYGHPVEGSERYPLRGAKRLNLNHDLLEDWDYFEKII